MERRGISGTGAPTTAETGFASNAVGPTPRTLTLLFDLDTEDLALDVWNIEHIIIFIILHQLHSSE